jgi:hypothetical protein
MTTPLLLGADDVMLWEPSPGDDTYGWAAEDAAGIPAWQGIGNLQLTGGTSDPRAAQGGGRGPFAPAQSETGQLFLPLDAPVTEGITADVRGVTYVLSQTHMVADPLGGNLGCWAATVTEVTTWP